MYADPEDLSFQRRFTPDWVRTIRRWYFRNKTFANSLAIFAWVFDDTFHYTGNIINVLFGMIDLGMLILWFWIFKRYERLEMRSPVAFGLGLFYMGLATMVLTSGLINDRTFLVLAHAIAIYAYGMWFIIRSDSKDLGEPKPGLLTKAKVKIRAIRVAITFRPALSPVV